MNDIGSFDHTQFRQYTSQLARWITPDPAGLLVADPSNPQSWNRYAYVLNNPTDLIDPFGLDGTSCTINGQPAICVTGTGFGPGGAPGGGPVGGGGSGFFFFGIGGGPRPHLFDFAGIGGRRPPLDLPGSDSGNSSGGFFSGLKDKFLDFLARNANYLPGVCTAGAFGFGTGGVGNDKGGLQGGVLIDKQIGQPATTQPIGEVGYGPVGVGQTPSETLVFVEPAPKVPVGVVYAANPQNGFINNSGISIGFFAGKAGSGKGLAGGFGGGAYLTFSSAANCLKNF